MPKLLRTQFVGTAAQFETVPGSGRQHRLCRAVLRCSSCCVGLNVLLKSYICIAVIRCFAHDIQLNSGQPLPEPPHEACYMVLQNGLVHMPKNNRSRKYIKLHAAELCNAETIGNIASISRQTIQKPYRNRLETIQNTLETLTCLVVVLFFCLAVDCSQPRTRAASSS